MSKTANTILTLVIVVMMAGLLLYGYCATQKLDERQEAKVVSTIGKHINYKEAKPTKVEHIETIENDGEFEDQEFEPYIEETDDEYIEEVIDTPELVAPEPEIPQAPKAAFLIIAGSFKSIGNAKNKVKQLEKKGLVAEIVQLPNSPLHSVSIGKESTEKAANDLMTSIKSQHNVKAYVYKNPQKNY